MLELFWDVTSHEASLKESNCWIERTQMAAIFLWPLSGHTCWHGIAQLCSSLKFLKHISSDRYKTLYFHCILNNQQVKGGLRLLIWYPINHCQMTANVSIPPLFKVWSGYIWCDWKDMNQFWNISARHLFRSASKTYQTQSGLATQSYFKTNVRSELFSSGSGMKRLTYIAALLNYKVSWLHPACFTAGFNTFLQDVR